MHTFLSKLPLWSSLNKMHPHFCRKSRWLSLHLQAQIRSLTAAHEIPSNWVFYLLGEQPSCKAMAVFPSAQFKWIVSVFEIKWSLQRRAQRRLVPYSLEVEHSSPLRAAIRFKSHLAGEKNEFSGLFSQKSTQTISHTERLFFLLPAALWFFLCFL